MGSNGPQLVIQSSRCKRPTRSATTSRRANSLACLTYRFAHYARTICCSSMATSASITPPASAFAGIGRLTDVVETTSHPLQLQERLGQQIADAILAGIDAIGVAVVIEARHSCVHRPGSHEERAHGDTGNNRQRAGSRSHSCHPTRQVIMIVWTAAAATECSAARE